MPTRALPLVSKSGYFQYTGDGAGMKEETETVMKQKANRNAHASAVTLDFKVTCDSSSDSSGWLSLFYPEFLPIRAWIFDAARWLVFSVYRKRNLGQDWDFTLPHGPAIVLREIFFTQEPPKKHKVSCLWKHVVPVVIVLFWDYSQSVCNAPAVRKQDERPHTRSPGELECMQS